jgi:hypothetical protein
MFTPVTNSLMATVPLSSQSPAHCAPAAPVRTTSVANPPIKPKICLVILPPNRNVLTGVSTHIAS